jgi:DNA-binding Lrp family transcriptional regulator
VSGKEGTTVTVKAYILIEAAIGKLSHVLNEIRNLPNVTEANAVAGPYDIITVVQVETADDVGRLVLETIHSLAGVNYTMTCVAISG